ncbi:hypothetical protein MY10362_007338 [Beauveria mimosiformis]
MAYTNEDEPAQPIQNPADPQPKYAEKQYTALAQGMLIILRRNKDLVVQPCSNDDEVPRDLLPLLDSSDWPINGIDDLSDKFQAQLREDRVVGLPGCFFPLQRHYTHDEQAKAAAPSLCYLREIGIISKIRHSNEERLRTVAKPTMTTQVAPCDSFMKPSNTGPETAPDLTQNKAPAACAPVSYDVQPTDPLLSESAIDSPTSDDYVNESAIDDDDSSD